MAESINGSDYRFTLKARGSPKLMGMLLILACKETELIYGKARLKLETSYELSARKPVCVIEGGTECGEHLAKLLSGFLIRQVGELGFLVERLRRPGRKT